MPHLVPYTPYLDETMKKDLIDIMARGAEVPLDPTQWTFLSVNLGNVSGLMKYVGYKGVSRAYNPRWSQAIKYILNAMLHTFHASVATITDQVLLVGWAPGRRVPMVSEVAEKEQIGAAAASIISSTIVQALLEPRDDIATTYHPHDIPLIIEHMPLLRTYMYQCYSAEAPIMLQHFISEGQYNAAVRRYRLSDINNKIASAWKKKLGIEEYIDGMIESDPALAMDPRPILGRIMIRDRTIECLPRDVLEKIPVNKRPTGPIARKIRRDIHIGELNTHEALQSFVRYVEKYDE